MQLYFFVLQPCLVLLLDPFTMLGMCALLPLLEAIDMLVNYAQKRDVYIYDFVAAIKVSHGDLYRMYEDKATSFSSDKFWSFNNLLECSHEQIQIKWITDLNNNLAVLMFVCHGEQLHAEHKGAPVDRDVWAKLVVRVKEECTGKYLLLPFSSMSVFLSFNMSNDLYIALSYVFLPSYKL